MKKSLLFLTLVLTLISGYTFSQDIILLKNGEEINSKILTIDSAKINYKKSDNLDGPVYILAKQEVFLIKYANGTKEIINPLNETKEKVQTENNFFNINNSVISIGYGFGNYVSWYNASQYNEDLSKSFIGSMYGKYEYAVTNDFELGLNFAYLEYKSNYYYEYYASSGLMTYHETDIYTTFSILLRANWHFEGSAKVDPYFGFGLGYRYAHIKYTTDDPNGNGYYQNYHSDGYYNFPIGFETTFGVRYGFSKHFGAYVEAGFAKSAVQMGLIAKF